MKYRIFIFCLIVFTSKIIFAESDVAGKVIAYDRTKGNCLACHEMGEGESPGNIGPKLENIRQRYPNKDLLRERIWDETKFNPQSVMPPFGKHRILTEEEIDSVVEYLYTL